MELFVLLCLTTSVLGCGIHLPTSNIRHPRMIVGGENVTLPTKWPWQVSLGNCGGTIISKRWILTAGHCFRKVLRGDDASRLTVLAGATRMNDVSNSTQLKAVQVIRHVNYNHTTADNDIALVKLDSSLEYSDVVAPICLPSHTQSIPMDGQAVVIGFGTANIRNTTRKIVDGQLRETIVPLIPPEICEERMRNIPPEQRGKGKAFIDAWSSKKVVCAGSYGHGSLQGDSGGPLMMKSTDDRWFQIGIVSFGVPDPRFQFDIYPKVFTDIRQYCDWIKETTGGEASCQEEEVTLEDVEIKS